jgi:hypothetical protein
MNYITLLLAHSCAFVIDHAKPKFEESTEQAQAEDLTNLALDQGKPQCILPHSLAFNCFESLYLCYA